MILEVRNGGRVLVRVQARAVLLRDEDIAAADARGQDDDSRRARFRGGSRTAQGRAAPAAPTPGASHRPSTSRTIDLHGCTVEAALARIDAAVNAALLDDVEELRVIHGRSGGRLREATHRRLRELHVRSVRLDPHNPGVTLAIL